MTNITIAWTYQSCDYQVSTSTLNDRNNNSLYRRKTRSAFDIYFASKSKTSTVFQKYCKSGCITPNSKENQTPAIVFSLPWCNRDACDDQLPQQKHIKKSSFCCEISGFKGHRGLSFYHNCDVTLPLSLFVTFYILSKFK